MQFSPVSAFFHPQYVMLCYTELLLHYLGLCSHVTVNVVIKCWTRYCHVHTVTVATTSMNAPHAKSCVMYSLFRAKEMLCNNALYPDLYGHYREAKFTQTKHHWWWKANRVFNQLEVTRNHSGMSVQPAGG